MTNFYSLEVSEVKRETAESVSILFNVPTELEGKFEFIQGQYITLRTELDGEEIRRSYSICSCPYGKELRVAVRTRTNSEWKIFYLCEYFIKGR